MSVEADALYRPLGGLEPWAEAPAADVPAGPAGPAGDDRAWAGLLARGMLLATAHQSGALDLVHDGDPATALSLLRGASTLAAVAAAARPHVQANHEALRLAAEATDDDLASQAWIRRIHRVACRPQLTHAVGDATGVQDHVLAAGDYKHHPNHVRTASGGWIARAPVDRLGQEMQRFAELARSREFRALPAVTQAAYAHHAVGHIAPFADGNGRVARALASAHLLRAASTPFLVFSHESAAYDRAVAMADAGDPAALVDFVALRCRVLAGHLAELRTTGPGTADQASAVDRWRERTEAAEVVDALLPDAVERALSRHRRRPDLGWLSRLDEAVVDPSPAVVGVRAVDVYEKLAVDPHPLLDDDALELRAEQAQLRLLIRPAELLPAVSDGFAAALDGWLDRAVSCLALRVAAALD